MENLIKCVYPRRVDTAMIYPLPLVKYEGEIEVVETEDALDAALAEISKEEILGFDTETRPNFNRNKNYPVSILQLAGENKVWVIRLDPLSERLADIYRVLENPSIKKAGLAVQGDIKSLRGRCALNPAGFVDVSASTMKIGIINTGMKNLVALIFGERISKSAQLSNWASDNLTSKQIDYAATDAWISRRLFLEVREIIKDSRTEIEPEPIPEPEHFNIINFVRKAIKSVAKKLFPTKQKRRKNRRKGSNYQRKKKSKVDAFLSLFKKQKPLHQKEGAKKNTSKKHRRSKRMKA